MTVKFEYVTSGAAHTRITLKDSLKPEILDPLKKAFRDIQGYANHDYTCLFNAYTEDRIGKHLYETNMTSKGLHADSGGLQVVTRGHTVTQDIMDRVYSIQGKYSKVAMCFDDIPLKVLGQSRIGDTSNRFFDRELLDDCVKRTCENITRQINAFEKMGSDSNVMLIAHGNEIDDYLRWISLSHKYLPKDIHDKIYGISLAGTSSGSGDKQDIERIFAFYKAECPGSWKKALHLLGVGSLSRLLPIAALAQNGILSDVKISYDSTTHTGNLTRGRYIVKSNKTIRTPKGQMKPHHDVLDCIKSKFPDYDIDPDYYFQIMDNNRDSFIESFGSERLSDYHQAMLLTCLSSIMNSTSALDLISRNRKAFLKFVNKRNFYMRFLLDIKNEADYEYFSKNLTKYMRNDGVKSVNDNNSILGFFS